MHFNYKKNHLRLMINYANKNQYNYNMRFIGCGQFFITKSKKPNQIIKTISFLDFLFLRFFI